MAISPVQTIWEQPEPGQGLLESDYATGKGQLELQGSFLLAFIQPLIQSGRCVCSHLAQPLPLAAGTQGSVS